MEKPPVIEATKRQVPVAWSGYLARYRTLTETIEKGI
jgi:hypothetical protein